jgi:micrococcal nuclease
MYEYAAVVTRVVDGDTVDARVDLGFGISFTERFRLSGINAPETRTRDKTEKVAGLRSKDFLERALGMGFIRRPQMMVRTSKDRKGKYGRYLAELILVEEHVFSLGDKTITLKAGTNLNKEMVRRRLAKRAKY